MPSPSVLSKSADGKPSTRPTSKLFGYGVLGLYAIASFVPHAELWGIDNLRYLPTWLGVAMLVAAAYFLNLRDSIKIGKQKSRILWQPKTMHIILIGSVSFAVFYLFPIATMIYGDHAQISKELVTRFEGSWFTDIITPNLFEGKEALTMAIHRSLAVLFSEPIDQIFRVVSALSGAIFVAYWANVVFKSAIARESQWGLFVAGLFGGGMLVFFGHVEVYALPMLGSFFFLVQSTRVLKREISFWPLLVLFVIIVKLHIINVLFLPALIYLFFECRRSEAFNEGGESWKQSVLLFIVPFLVFGLAAYFFLFHSYNEPYIGDKARQFQQSFLPLTPLAAPYDHYGLLAPAHILDLVNVFLFIGGPVILLLVGVAAFNRRTIRWQGSSVKFAALSLLFPLIFFCSMNPTLSIARDWDIYALCYPPLLLFLFTMVSENPIDVSVGRKHNSYILKCSLAFAVLTIPAIAVNVMPGIIAARLFDLSDHVYRTYYAGSHYLMSAGLESATPNERRIKLASLIKDIRPAHRGTTDEEGAGILIWRAKLFIEDQVLDSAFIALKEARSWDPTFSPVLQSLIVVANATGDTISAKQYQKELSALLPKQVDVANDKKLR